MSTGDSGARGRGRRLLDALLLLLFFAYVFLSFLKPLSDPDTPWHLKTGEYILQTRSIPTDDPFSFADDKIPFIGKFILSQYWLAQAVFAVIYRAAGPFGLVLMSAVVFSSLIAILWYLLKSFAYPLRIGMLGLITLPLVREYMAVRPQMFTFLFSALLLWLFKKYEETENSSYLFVLPALMVVWSNMHGGFIFGAVIIVAYLVDRGVTRFVSGNHRSGPAGRIKPEVLIVSLVALTASACNPNGYKAFMYAFSTHSKGLFSMIGEYQTPWQLLRQPGTTTGIYRFWGILPVAALLLVFYTLKRQVREALLLAASAALALGSMRYIPLFAICLTYSFAGVRQHFSLRDGARLVLVAYALCVAGLTYGLIDARKSVTTKLASWCDSAFYSPTAADFMKKEGIKGRIYSSYNKSSFLLFALFPQSQLYSDSRFLSPTRINVSMNIESEFDSPKEVVESISRLVPKEMGSIQVEMPDLSESVVSGGSPYHKLRKDWEELLSDIHANIIVHEAVNYFSRKVPPMVFKLMSAKDWKLVYQDGYVMIFVRDVPEYAGIILRNEKPKRLMLEQIIDESGRLMATGAADPYANIALAELLKGNQGPEVPAFIQSALEREKNNLIANYSMALYALMKSERAPR